MPRAPARGESSRRLGEEPVEAAPVQLVGDDEGDLGGVRAEKGHVGDADDALGAVDRRGGKDHDPAVPVGRGEVAHERGRDSWGRGAEAAHPALRRQVLEELADCRGVVAPGESQADAHAVELGDRGE